MDPHTFSRTVARELHPRRPCGWVCRVLAPVVAVMLGALVLMGWWS